jgi:hypothetical protein
LQNAVRRKKESDAAFAGGRRQRQTDRHQARFLRLGVASNDDRPSSIRPSFHQRQAGQ